MAFEKDDVATRNMIEDFVADDAEHYRMVMKHLGIIERMGYDNYLLEMLNIGCNKTQSV